MSGRGVGGETPAMPAVRTMLATLAALALLAVLGGTVPAAAQNASVRTALDTTRMTVGDRVHLTVTVEHDPGSRVAWPDSLDLAPFEVLEARVAEPAARGDRVVSTAVLTLTAFELGTLEVPSFELEVSGAGEGQTVETDRYGVEVASVGVDEGGDIREIRGPLALPVSVVGVGLWVLLGVLLAALAYALYRRFRRRDGPEAAPAAPPRPPHEVALAELAALASSSLLVEGRVKEYYIRASEILRRYVEDRFGVPALEMTTGEVLHGLARAPVPGEFRTGLQAFLEPCDMVKFAKARPSAADARALVEQGRALVVTTVPTGNEAGDSADAPDDSPPGTSDGSAPPARSAAADAAPEGVASDGGATAAPSTDPGAAVRSAPDGSAPATGASAPHAAPEAP